ncbi:MAG: ABC transporter substrate-binding protein [Sphingomonadaceae bacterium]
MKHATAPSLRATIAALLGMAAVAAACQGPPAAPAQPAAPTQAPDAKTAAPPAQSAKAPVRLSLALDWYPNSNHAGLYVAQANGYYRDEGLEVELYVPSNPEDVLKLVGSGKDSLGISYQSDVLLAAAEGIPVKSVAALVQHPLNSVTTLKSSNLTRPKQLEGKKVGYPGIPGQEALLKTMMEKDGGSFDKVELVNVGFELVQPLIGKKVDASLGTFWTHETILAEMEGYPVDVMRVEEWGVPDYYELVFVTNDKTAREQPDAVRAFLRATAKGYADAAKDPQKALDQLVKNNPETNREVEEKGIQLLRPLWTEGVPSFGWQTRERWQSYADWMRQMKLLSAEVKAESVFTTEFLPR